MGKPTEDQHQGLKPSPRWSPDEETTFLDMLVEEFINKQPEAMNALIALVLNRVSKITDEGWNRVAIRLTDCIGKKYTTAQLKEQMKRLTQRFQCMDFEQGGPGMNCPRTKFEPYSEHENDTRDFRSPDEKVPTPGKEAKNSDGCNVSDQYPEDCARDSNRSSDKVSYQEVGPGIDFPCTPFEQSVERENDAGVSRSPDENFSIPENEGRNSDGCNGSVPYPEESVRNSEASCGNVPHEDSGPGLDFPSATFEPYFDHDNDAGAYWTPEASHQEEGLHMDFPYTSEPYFEYSNDTGVYWSPDENFPYPGDCVRNSYRSFDDGSYQDGSSGIRESPIEKNSIPEKEDRNSDGCNGTVPYLDKTVGSININCDNGVHQDGGPDTSFHHTKFVPSHEHDSDAGIFQSPVESVSIPEKDSTNYVGCNNIVTDPEGSIRSSNRSCGDVNPQEDFVHSGVNPSVSCPKECEGAEKNVEDSGVNPNVSCPKECEDAEENVEDSGVNSNVSCPKECDAEENLEDSRVNHNVYHTRELEKATETAGESGGSKRSDAEKHCGSSRECENVSSPLVDVESVSKWYDSATSQQENTTNSTPRYEDYETKESMGCCKRPAADPFDSSDYKRSKWSSYSEAKTTCGVSQNPDDGDSFSFARCRNILHGMRRIDSQFRDTALDLLEDQYYRKFFMQMKHDKRLDWLSSILGMEH